MKKELVIGLFSLVVLLQIATPASMILKRESVLKNGKQFRFKTAPVDPYDAFRGRYVALRLEVDRVSLSQRLNLKHNQRVYAHIFVDKEEFAGLSTVTTTRPKGVPYIQAEVRYVSGNNVHLRLPIDRYYMEEKAAPAAERVYRQHSRQDKQDAYILVRIKDGFPVIEGLYIGGKRIEEVVK